MDLDLSEVLFITTANVAETIPGPLFDRMEVIRIDGYTEDEKVAIAKHHLVARQRERNGLREDEVTFTDDALRVIVADYTREAGVRNLERELGKALRKVATKIAAGDVTPPVAIDEEAVREHLGRQRFFFEAADRTAVPGVATGLAVTGVGGDVLFIEASREDEGEGLILTGQLGDVMKESAQIALSYVRSHAERLGIEPARLRRDGSTCTCPRGGAQGRPERRRHVDDGSGVAAHGYAGAPGGGHDRRGHPAGSRAADRRSEAEGAGRSPGGV